MNHTPPKEHSNAINTEYQKIDMTMHTTNDEVDNKPTKPQD